MVSEEFLPANELERVLLDGQEGRSPVAAIVRTLLASQVFVLWNKAPAPHGAWDSSAVPLVISSSGGASVLAVFSSAERSTMWAARFPEFSFGLLVDFRWLLQGLGAGIGLAINPGFRFGLEMSPSGVARMKAEVTVSFPEDRSGVH